MKKTAKKAALQDKKSEARIEILERKVWQLTIDNDFLKKTGRATSRGKTCND
jgi:hypothetical protein